MTTTNTFTEAYDAKIRPLMDKIDQARSLLSWNDDGVVFPSVVVVGDQSSGKSTLLEALSLVELPKGSGIVTRCPLVLRLRKCNQRRVHRLYGDNQKELLDESKLNILKYIEEETKKLAGDHKNVVKNLIELQVEDPNVRDLTVVDLPGIARNAIADQPQDIHIQTTNLIRHFIRQEGSVILCVFPANVDVATVESFTLAREFDPSGIRTIGVITKSDLAPNPDALAQQLLMESSDVLHLKLGFVAVRNRSTDERITLEASRKREKEFFDQHSASTIAGWNCLGIDALISRLADLYSDRVRDIFPTMRKKIHDKLREVREQLSKLPPDLDTPQARLAKFYELSEFFVENFLKERFAASDDGHRVSTVNTLHIKFTTFDGILNSLYRELFSPKYREKVRKAMAARFGEQLPNFLPHPILKRLISEKLDQLWSYTETLIDDCFRTTFSLLSVHKLDECENDLLLVKLLPLFRDVVTSFLSGKKQAVREQLKELIRLEKDEPYTINHYYMETVNKFRERAEKQKEENAEKINSSSANKMDSVDDESLFNAISNDDQAVQDMMISIYAYWKLLIKRFMDYVSLSIRSACVFGVCPGIRTRLRQIPLEQLDIVDSYLAEDAFIRNKRKQLQQTKERLQKVDAILGGGSGENTDLTRIDDGSKMTLEKLVEQFRDSDDQSNIAASSSLASALSTEKLPVGVKSATAYYPSIRVSSVPQILS